MQFVLHFAILQTGAPFTVLEDPRGKLKRKPVEQRYLGYILYRLQVQRVIFFIDI